MQRFQMSVKPSYNMTPNQRKMLAERRNADVEVTKSKKKTSTFIFASIGVVVIAAIAGVFVAMNKGKTVEAAENQALAPVNDDKLPTEDISNTTVVKAEEEQPAPEVKEETQPVVEPVKPVEVPEVVEKAATVNAMKPHTVFADNFFQKIVLIQDNLNVEIKRDILKNWASDSADFSMKWRKFSTDAKENARWGISRKASELADDWEYLAEFLSKGVKQDDREYLRDLVADIIERETTLKNQCEN